MRTIEQQIALDTEFRAAARHHHKSCPRCGRYPIMVYAAQCGTCASPAYRAFEEAVESCMDAE